MKKSQKIILVGSIILLIAGGVFWYWNNLQQHDNESMMSYHEYLEQYGEKIELPEVDTTGWETYRDEEFGFEFLYPGDEWEVNLPEGRGRAIEYLEGGHREKKKPMHWDSGIKGKLGGGVNIICIERRDVTHSGNRCYDRESAVSFSVSGPIWGNKTAEELWVEHLINDVLFRIQKGQSSKSEYVQVDGYNIKQHLEKEYVLFDIYHNQVRIHSSIEEKSLLIGIIQTFKLIE